MALHRLVILLGVVFMPALAAAATYYVSPAGSDDRSGLSPQAAWQTLERVNEAKLRPGDRVLFRRGGTWRGQLRPQSGSPAGHVLYGAYGRGAKPLLLGSVARSRPADWRHETGDIWVAGGFPREVGNLIFDGERSCGVKVWREADLQHPGDFWYDDRAEVLKVCSPENPAIAHTAIECALTRHLVDESGVEYAIYEQLDLRYAGAHGIGGGNTHHIIVRDCDLSWIGGGFMQLGGRPVRYGNGIEFWGSAHDNLVERCRLWEIYDAALTNQNNGEGVLQADITYRHNTIWHSEYSFEYWNRPAESSRTKNIVFEHNTCRDAGGGWSHSQRPDPGGRQLCFYSSDAPAEGLHIRHNLFAGAANNAFYAPTYGPAELRALDMDHNQWWQPEGTMILLKGKSYTQAQFADYQRETGLEGHSRIGRQ